jgi:hypothetical protein
MLDCSRLAKKGLEHLERCLPCDQEGENIDHLLVGCVFTRHLWFLWFEQMGLQDFAPHVEVGIFPIW